MERVAFLIEATGERLGCLLNPESLIIRRQAGVRSRQLAGGLVAGSDLTDDQLLYSGGGSTEITMKLLFDVSLTGSSITTDDVRDLTGPIWRLAENSGAGGRYGNPPICRFVWGKSWNIPGIVPAVAEKFEHFTSSGSPRRSWINLLFRRVQEPSVARSSAPGTPSSFSGIEIGGATGVEPRVETYEVVSGERPDQIAQACYQDPSLSRALMAYNQIDDPLHIPAGTILDLPRLTDLVALL